ncbi:MAG TPA: VOC family protein [Acidobacteriaceae bacterium]|nr:VOC family protein [Acidobacteriaceae bacterium]
MQRITPFLWFDDKAEEAAHFYASIFKNAKVGKITYYGREASNASGRPAGSVMTVAFQLDGQEFLALNGGPHFHFNEAVSLVVNCETQAEIDDYWKKLSSGGQESQCGWLKDKYGLSWQVVPTGLSKWMSDDPKKSARVMNAILHMRKLDIQTLRDAYDKV